MHYVFITGWSHGDEIGGLSQFAIDPETGKLDLIRHIEPGIAFGTVFYNKEKNVLYAVNEDKALTGGWVYSYSIDPETGDLKEIGKVSTLAPNPAYLGIDGSGKFAVVADHSNDAMSASVEKGQDGKYKAVIHINDAVVVLFELNDDGTLGEAVDVVKHTGTSIAVRQNMPHPHCTVFSPDGKYCAVCDKGNDYVYIYTVDTESKSLKLVTRWKETPGSKPRYAAFHPTLPYFYHNNEGTTIVDAFKFDDAGHFDMIGEFSAADEGYDGKAEQQGFAMHPSGRYLYDANKGPLGIAVFEIDQESGALTRIQNVVKDLDWLRGIAVSPCGKFLIATYMHSDKAILYIIGEDGKLSESGVEVDVSRAAGIEFASV